MNSRSQAWEVDEDDFGGRIVRHRHADITATAYVFSNPDQVWAECSLCGAELGLVMGMTEGQPAVSTPI